MARILVIEDDDAVRSVITGVLAAAGHTVEEARNGKQGLACHKGADTDLVVLDLIMPVKEGLETIVELKQKFPAVKILAISGGGRMAPHVQLHVAKKLGARAVLAKPFSIEQLSTAVKELLEVVPQQSGPANSHS